jgi:hypothetical protein
LTAETITFVLPDGAVALVSAAVAREIAARLWDLGITPGATTAAARIVDVLRARPMARNSVVFDERDVGALLRVADGIEWLRTRSTSPRA